MQHCLSHATRITMWFWTNMSYGRLDIGSLSDAEKMQRTARGPFTLSLLTWLKHSTPSGNCSASLVVCKFGMLDQVHVDGVLSDPFPITNGIKHDCVTVPLLFNLFYAAMVDDATTDLNAGIRIYFQSSWKLFHLKSCNLPWRSSRQLFMTWCMLMTVL